jgi:tRNA(fMet)-specific endonuclease VapC
MKALLDTDMLSEVLKSKDPHVVARARAYHAQHGRYTISTITIMEIVKGLCRKQREEAVQRFLAVVKASEVVTLDPVSAELAGRIYADLERGGRPIGVADVLIGAMAMHLGLTLVTGNASDYEHIVSAGYPLRIESWRAV